MLEIRVNDNFEWSIKYYIDTVVATELMTKDKAVAMKEIEMKLSLEMGLAKGKKFITQTGREI